MVIAEYVNSARKISKMIAVMIWELTMEIQHNNNDVIIAQL